MCSVNCYWNESQREKMRLLTCAPDKDLNNPVNPRYLIRALVARMKKLCILGYPNWVILNTPSDDSAQTMWMRMRMLGGHFQRRVFWRRDSKISLHTVYQYNGSTPIEKSYCWQSEGEYCCCNSIYESRLFKYTENSTTKKIKNKKLSDENLW